MFDQQLCFTGLKADHLNFYVNDYSELSAIYGEKIDGIIGYAFLKRYIVKINFDSSFVQFYSPGKIKYGRTGTVLTPPINNLPIQQLSIKDKRKVDFNFYMDTGAGLCFLMSDQFAKDSTILLDKRKPVITQAEGLGGKTLMRLTVIKQLKLGPYRFYNVPVHLYDDKLNITAYPFVGGLLGNDIMRRFNMVLNYPSKEIFITPNSHFPDEFDYAYTGLMLYDDDLLGIIIKDVIKDSPAYKAGLKENDVVVSINNNFSGKIITYSNLLQKAKEKIKLIIKRNGVFEMITIEPTSILR